MKILSNKANAIQSRLIMFQSQPSDYYLVMQNLPDLIALIEEVESFSVSCRKVIAGYQNDLDRKSTRLNSSHNVISRMPSSA